MQTDTIQMLVGTVTLLKKAAMHRSRPFHALMHTGAYLSAFAAGFSAAPVAAASVQDGQPDQPEPPDRINASQSPADEIIVEAERLRGQLIVEQPPLLELNEEDIAAEGVASIADLVEQITAQTGSARGRGGGRPVTLINGIRVGSFREFFQYPPEALARVEVFPEEVAQRFGFPPDRRVINLILKDNFASREVELEFEGPSRGDYFVNEQELGYLKITDGGRLNLNFEANDTSLLTESERNIIQTPGSISDLASDPDQAEFRSLIADSRSLVGNISWAKAFIDSGASVSANLNYQRNDSTALSGLNIVTLMDKTGETAIRTFGEDTPLERRVSSDTFSSSGSFSKSVNAFRLTTTFDGSLSETETQIDRRLDTSSFEAEAAAGLLSLDGPLPANADAGFDIASSQSIAAVSQSTLRGPVDNLPAGEVIATFDVGADWLRIDSDDTRSFLDTRLTRRRLSTGANFVIPLTSRRNGFADALGSFTLTAQAGLEDLSDFGLLGDYNVGLNWEPTERLNLSVNYILREVAPTLAQLGNPQITNFNMPIFDFVNGETVLATVISGGNPDLLAETQRDWKFAANWQLPFWDNTRLTVEYIRNRSDDVTSDFPTITSEIETAFPDRITRDQAGQLTEVDTRFVTFAETRSDRLQINLFTRGTFGAPDGGQVEGRRERRRPESSEAARPRGGPPRPSGGPPDPERRERFMRLRSRICAEDGGEVLSRLVSAVENGEDLGEIAPGVPPQFLERVIDRARGEDGAVSKEALDQFRERICAGEGRPGGGGGEAERQAAGERGARRGGGGPFGGGNPFASGQRPGWRYFASLNHTIELQNDILIAPGIARLDQLDGDGTGAFGFPRHNTRLEAGLFGKGLGVRLSALYTGVTRLDGSGLPGSSDIFFDDLATFDLRVFSNLADLFGSDSAALKNLRVSLRADNIFDGQRQVRDENGNTPINYQPFLIDPIGRFIGIDIRKLF
ncbi:TonB-dependent receptor [Erythrobacter rubeus]|uniref:TonB-dependent receptor n=1 Tax=Erythrobacter rubeus TaxID=2760803 RepID=A0ABR8KNR7_9SPHN|nr:hypothetical protein [Erythrobacter rubeus]MBD2842348.1 hypothetical protein [Erythrobacter rubeus]